MFTGIIEATGKLMDIQANGTNLTFTIESDISNELKVDQSIAHNGICLTVEKQSNNQHSITAIKETIEKTNAGNWKIGDTVNLERCLKFDGRIDGHFVQGHVDDVATCVSKKEEDGSWLYQFQFNEQHAALMIEKGSVTINGISLTCFNVTNNTFNVAIIPYTYTHTNMHLVNVGTKVNIEFDVFGKYMSRFNELLKK